MWGIVLKWTWDGFPLLKGIDGGFCVQSNEPSIFIEVWEFLDKVSVSAFQEGLCFVEVAEENNSIAARKNVTPDRYN
jgi:hypothetical protein